ncbi:MAG: bifunctional UDP-N-acetylmuramoyl-tripeptide:D-alanyl-D-alanine ligase/alanine racemase [Bacteroidetes bacterium]|nr:bifunctional UDP-N-acetylmuramoyl-tripeptide:D-alanyl-D-alanine ligase/alanine racemase [Bacteroidota bacterium]MBU1717925.1 bifunctional UDP-N-acetylmuramoyl-tripeptide:D-alanyl-D-alanine ligase/alanine racemase [Bacteroidota bacterium]
MRSGYSIIKLAEWAKGQVVQSSSDNQICNLLIDTRNFTTAAGTLFFAIMGKRHNGHEYLEEAYNKGIRDFVIQNEASVRPDWKDANFVLVKNSESALQKIAAEHRKQFHIPVIAITGSNGKTIVKEWLYQLMFEDKKIVRSPKSFNSQVGVPLSVWQMTESDELAIFEAGISEPDEMQKLQPIIQPTIGIFTNIGAAHDENFIHTNQKIGEKLKLFTQVDTLIYCNDFFEIKEKILKSGITGKIKLFTWAFNQPADLKILKVIKSKYQSDIEANHCGRSISISIPFTDDAAVSNAISCWATMIVMGYSNEIIASRTKMLSSVAMRLEVKEGVNNCTIVNDSYNSDINSLHIALDFLEQQKQHSKKTLIISDILQSGRTEDDLYQEVSELAATKGISRIIGIGDALSRQKNKFSGERLFFKTTEDFLLAYQPDFFSNETILVKGARKFRFEKISQLLQQKAHETTLEINLNAIVANLNYYRSLLKPTTKIMAMVKAFGYGSGSFEIANLLQFHRVDYLAVAYADEGVELRKAGITMPIIVMNPDQQGMNSIIANNLEPEVFSFRCLTMLEESISRLDNAISKKTRIHIKFDTGMHRLGFLPAETGQLADRLNQMPNVELVSVFSHLVASDDDSHDAFTQLQINTFQQVTEKLRVLTGKTFLQHILNTSGIVRFTSSQLDMVRPGIGLYGAASGEHAIHLQHVATLKSTISQIKEIPKGESVGYKRKFIAQRPMRIATVPVGYADGLSRTLGNGNGEMIVNSRRVKIIGDICMDMCMLDITDADACEGDEVIVFGKEMPVTELANKMSTIPYEVLSNLSRRIKRVYYQD